MRKPGQAARTVPEAPKAGDTIGVVAPGSAVSKYALEKGCERLRALGYRVFFFESILEKDVYFAGTHPRRAWELEQMFAKPFVKAILCARGGYGCNHLLPSLNLDVIRQNPKMIVGYSDVTTLLTWIADQTDMVTFHGPMVAKDYAECESMPPISAEVRAAATGPQVKTGDAEGVLYGGCLSMIAASLGTPYEVETEGTVLFLEDVNTKPFQIDRMLMQLKYAGKLKGVRGIVFGEMADCVQPGGHDYTLQEVIGRTLADFAGPIGFGVRSGHLASYAKPGVTLGIGKQVRLVVEPDGCRLVGETYGVG
ncbi:MAG: LD-carboxypeptidase [Acidobacteriales bacterium]|nr:LD-carboxypeptidase [Terriglobales bacterium]